LLVRPGELDVVAALYARSGQPQQISGAAMDRSLEPDGAEQVCGFGAGTDRYEQYEAG
jgi:hypothetical protein